MAVGEAVLAVVVSHLCPLVVNEDSGETRPEALLRALRRMANSLSRRFDAPSDAVGAARLCLARMAKNYKPTPARPDGFSPVPGFRQDRELFAELDWRRDVLVHVHSLLFPGWYKSPTTKEHKADIDWKLPTACMTGVHALLRNDAPGEARGRRAVIPIR
jgi:hypothetical protein